MQSELSTKQGFLFFSCKSSMSARILSLFLSKLNDKIPSFLLLYVEQLTMFFALRLPYEAGKFKTMCRRQVLLVSKARGLNLMVFEKHRLKTNNLCAFCVLRG